MSWAPTDLVSDADLLAYESRIQTWFGQWDWRDRRAKALEDWLWPQVRTAGFDPQRFRTRYTPTAVYSAVSGTFTDWTAAAQSATAEDLTLATIFGTGSVCYVGSAALFRGLSLRVTDTPSATAATLTVALWRDGWRTVAAADGTVHAAGVSCSGGGAITWTLPDDWTLRSLNSLTAYWARLSLSAVPTGAKAGQLACIRRSLLCGPATLRTLALIFREAPISQDGPWRERADWYEAEAERAIQRVLPVIGGEFEAEDSQDDVIDATEAVQTASEARDAAGWSWERA